MFIQVTQPEPGMREAVRGQLSLLYLSIYNYLAAPPLSSSKTCSLSINPSAPPYITLYPAPWPLNLNLAAPHPHKRPPDDPSYPARVPQRPHWRRRMPSERTWQVFSRRVLRRSSTKSPGTPPQTRRNSARDPPHAVPARVLTRTHLWPRRTFRPKRRVMPIHISVSLLVAERFHGFEFSWNV